MYIILLTWWAQIAFIVQYFKCANSDPNTPYNFLLLQATKKQQVSDNLDHIMSLTTFLSRPTLWLLSLIMIIRLRQFLRLHLLSSLISPFDNRKLINLTGLEHNNPLKYPIFCHMMVYSTEHEAHMKLTTTWLTVRSLDEVCSLLRHHPMGQQ